MSAQPALQAASETLPMRVHRVSATIVMISVDVEVDATNADQLASCIQATAAHSAQLVVDLSGCRFLSTAGFFALQRASFGCSRAGTDWRLVGSRAVQRALTLCDPEGILPLCASPATAIAALRGESLGRLRLVEAMPA